MSRSRLILFVVLAFSALLTFGAAADDWVAVKLRGGVFVYVDSSWVQLKRGDIVSDDRVIRTQPSGRATFMRGQETIEIGPSTQIQIIDRAGKRFTTVRQFYGHVEIEADVLNVQHFGVRTPYLAAVVKGTRFSVDTDDNSSSVEVERGKVAVENLRTNDTVLLLAGQSIDTTTFTTQGASLVLIPSGNQVPPDLFTELGGNETAVLDTLFGGSGHSAGSGGGLAVDIDLGGGNGISLTAGGGNGVNLDAGLDGLTVDLGVGGGNGIDLGVGAGGTGLGVGVGGGEGVTVSAPVGTVNLLGGLL